jgi:hypothetical protein
LGVYGGVERNWAALADIGRTHVATKGVVQSGLILNLDAGVSRSYGGSGTTWTDLSGLGNNGTLTNGPTYSSANGGSIVFDGSNDYISRSNPSLTNQITVEVWVNLSLASPNSTGWILGREQSYRLLYDYPNSFSWICATTTNGWYTAGTYVGASVVSQSGIYHVVGTYDGLNNRIYVNGTLQETGSAISGNILNTGYTYNLFKSDAANISYGKGNLYSHRLYNRALSAAEIQRNFNAMRGRFSL